MLMPRRQRLLLDGEPPVAWVFTVIVILIHLVSLTNTQRTDLPRLRNTFPDLPARNVSFITAGNGPSGGRGEAAQNNLVPLSSSSALQFDLCQTAMPCRNNGTCQSAPGKGDVAFQCICQRGWTGAACEVDLDECADGPSGPCQNGAMCRNVPGSFQCYCIPGFLGALCEIEADECLARPCRNGASCVDRLNGYECICPIGFRGKNCEIDIDECEPKPCLNGANCVDLPGNYSCICAAGFTGSHCQVNIDECEPHPCLHGGRCIDGINSFTCNCVNTGFTGRLCELEVDDCASSPCQHGGVCHDIGADYTCECYDGFLGRNCEVDIDECTDPAPPCHNGATCLQRSNISLYYDHKFLGVGRAFSYNNSAGYVCQCLPGFTGVNCEQQVDECLSHPCFNGANCTDLINAYACTCLSGWEGTNCERDIDECGQDKNICSGHGICENLPGSYRCRCEDGYAGRRCSVALSACETKSESGCANGVKCLPSAKCSEGSKCVAMLMSEEPVQEDFFCVCPPGRAGRLCHLSSVAAFSTDGLIQLSNVSSLANISFQFRTTLNESLLMLAVSSLAPFLSIVPRPTPHVKQYSYVVLQIDRGKLELASVVGNGQRKSAFWSRKVNDGQWQNVQLRIEQQTLTVTLMTLDNSSQSARLEDQQTVQLPNPLISSSNVSEMFFGGLEQRLRQQPPFTLQVRSNMNGCMRDIALDGRVLAPGELSTSLGSQRRQSNVRSVCERRDQCSLSTCNQRGNCLDLWNRYQCQCRRPFYGLSCEKEIAAGTFNREGSKSLATLKLSQADRAFLQLTDQISFIIRTLENDSLILYLGSEDGQSFIIVRISEGQLVLQLRLMGLTETIRGSKTLLNDGKDHTVYIQREQGVVRMRIDEEDSVISQLASASPLKAEIVLLGGALPQAQARAVKRQIPNSDSDSVSLFNQTRTLPESGQFKGVLQDIRLNGRLLPLFPLDDSSQLEGLPPSFAVMQTKDVVEGVRSDDSCKSSPCQNGGICRNTWNDYQCSCGLTFRGKNCELQSFCLNNECPSSHATCRALDNDYECQTSVSLLDLKASITWKPTAYRAPNQVRSLSFRFRTRISDGNVISLMGNYHQLRVLVRQARLQLEYRLSNTPAALTVDRPVNDSLWHRLQATFLPNSMTISIDGQTFSQEQSRADVSLTALLQENGSFVEIGGDFIGCMEDIRLGPYLLPFFPEATSTSGAPSLPRLVHLDKMTGAVEYGCRGRDVCSLEACPAGQCVDLWNARKCQCQTDSGSDEEVLACAKLLPGRDRLQPAECQGLQCYHNGILVCQLESLQSENATIAPYCNCTEHYTGPRCENEIPLTSALPVATTDNLAIILGVSLSLAGIVLIGALLAFCLTAKRRRAERGAYSPSRQEMFGSRVEMDTVLKPPPLERLI